ncbi:MAG: hypothetical protein JWP36_1368 [Paucimonas sp.]|nr:hypothetical protein [Paucimonas sp.]
MQSKLHVLSGGAAKAVVQGLEQQFAQANGAGISGTYGAVGAMRDLLLAGQACDVVILSAALVDELAASGHVMPDTIAPLGRVKTAIAVPDVAPQPDVGDAGGLRQALLAATAIYFPDPERATAGIHFANVLRRLGIHDQVAPALRPFPNGATAMAQMAASGDAAAIGCTQVTEILYTPGVRLVAPLPQEFELATLYSAAVVRTAANPQAARMLVAMMGAADSLALRRQGGFEA